MQVAPNWSMNVDAAQFKANFNTEFAGPGIYLTKTDTMVVVRKETKKVDISEWVWEKETEKEFVAHVYNCPFSDTIFSAIAIAPVRLDTRL